MKILKEETAQGSAEMILLFGGIIVIAIAALVFYRDYTEGLGNELNGSQLNNTTNEIQKLKYLFK